MNTSVKALALALSLQFGLTFAGASGAAGQSPDARSEVVRLWPGQPPGTEDWKGPETELDQPLPASGRSIHIIKNVSDPSLTVVRPAPGKATGAAMIVLPGGAFGALAWDLEGTEVARWLADRGITAFILKYRVHDADPAMAAKLMPLFAKPGPNTFDQALAVLEPRRKIAAEDALQAVRLIRSDARRFGITPDRIGMIGFSAGAMTTMSAATATDPASRPNFAATIYGALAVDTPAPKDGPPLFIAAAEDDTTVPICKSIAIFEAWQAAGMPAELHIYKNGGHGFGLGKAGTDSVEWPTAFGVWLHGLGLTADGPPVAGH